MDDELAEKLLNQAADVLKQNDRTLWTVPANQLYPHQWLWDSCFIAIGLRHLNIERAQTELTSLLRGQWDDGMLPNIIFADQAPRRHLDLWRSWVSPYAPEDVATSGVTQPPMLAEAVLQVGKKLKLPERRSWYKQMLPALIRYHEWLYSQRDPHQEGLIVLLHPYESGLDNSPTWISEMYQHSLPVWIKLIEKLRLDGVITLFRSDTKLVPPSQRTSNIVGLTQWSAIRRLRRKAYNSEAVMPNSLFAVEDLAFNCMFIRANRCLQEIAKTTGQQLADELLINIINSESALEKLWDEPSGQYYSRSFVSHKLIEEPTIATLLPLYAGSISKDRAAHLVDLLKRRRLFSTSWPVPSVPLSSSYFDPQKYWQGPSWVNTNWLIIEGLRRYKYADEADILQARTLDMVNKSGCYEYFNSLDGSPAGSPNFSWTAALTIDLLKN